MTENIKRIYKAPALEKGLNIIELLAEKQMAMTMGQIATSLGRSKNEIFRMLSVLEQKNYIKKQDNGEKYGITNHLFDLGMRVPPTPTLIELIAPTMNELASNVIQSCHLSVRSGGHIVVIFRIENPAPVGFAVRIGLSRTLEESASGKLFLAMMPTKKREELITQLIAELGQKFDKNSLESELNIIRTQGHAIIPSSFISGITDISMPITQGKGGEIIASLTIPYSSSVEAPCSLEETMLILKKTAAEISKKIAPHRKF